MVLLKGMRRKPPGKKGTQNLSRRQSCEGSRPEGNSGCDLSTDIDIGHQQVQFSSVQSLSRVRLFVTPWTAAHQASLSITIRQSLLKLISMESVMPSNHLILCHPLLLLPSIFPSIRVFSNESVLHISEVTKVLELQLQH